MQIVMGTFILTFVGRSLTSWLQASAHLSNYIESDDLRRKLLVIAYFITIALILAVFGILTIPYIVREGADFISRLQAENIWCVAPRPSAAAPCSLSTRLAAHHLPVAPHSTLCCHSLVLCILLGD
jgi:hypothetical protein